MGMIETLYGFGLTDAQITTALDINETTLANWKKDERFLRALKKGKEISDDRVVRSLYERATGFTHPEDDIRIVDGEVKITQVLKHYPPDTGAAIFWLKNRRRGEWRAKVDVEQSGRVNLTVIPLKFLDPDPQLPEE